jgi:putative membrane protein
MMHMIAFVLVCLVAALQGWFLVLEMFLFRTPLGRKTFGTTAEDAEKMATLAANQGLYNGFLAAGLVWALIREGVMAGRPTLTFFLACVVLAGVYGAATASRKILFVQALPAAAALALVWMA